MPYDPARLEHISRVRRSGILRKYRHIGFRVVPSERYNIKSSRLTNSFRFADYPAEPPPTSRCCATVVADRND
jgi:hypothetical protein